MPEKAVTLSTDDGAGAPAVAARSSSSWAACAANGRFANGLECASCCEVDKEPWREFIFQAACWSMTILVIASTAA